MDVEEEEEYEEEDEEEVEEEEEEVLLLLLLLLLQQAHLGMVLVACDAEQQVARIWRRTFWLQQVRQVHALAHARRWRGA